MGNCTNFCEGREETFTASKLKMDQIEQSSYKKSISKNNFSNNNSEDKEKQKNQEKICDEKFQEQIKLSLEEKEYAYESYKKKNYGDKSSIISNKSLVEQTYKNVNFGLVYSKNPEVAETIGIFTRKYLPPVNLENGAVYSGEWKNGLRDGRGLQNWPDNSKYEGDWKEDQANGIGKLTHADGDIYEGEWVNDKACGKGVYLHGNGARYEGIFIL